MKMITKILLILICLNLQSISLSAKEASEFNSKISDIPDEIKEKMLKYTWKPGCPVPISDLKYVTIPFYNFDNLTHLGHLIIHKDLANEVVTIFKELYKQKFPIEKMQLIEDYNGIDNDSMSANNTSSFNCRPVTGKTGVYSLHSYGKAIDINPKLNPYIKENIVLPENGKSYINRVNIFPGMITKDSFIYKTFIEHNWGWGGNWKSLKDYQHFEKIK